MLRSLSPRRTAVAVGVLFLVQMITAMFGTSLVSAFEDGNRARGPVTAGVVLMICAGLAITGIGFLMYPILRAVSPRLAPWYPALRVTELLVSAACGSYLLLGLEVVPNHLLWVYIPTGLGGIVLTWLLLTHRLVPRGIAALGLAGYTILLAGVPLDLLGVLDLNHGAGLLLLAPGGLFEFLFMPIWLITRGFTRAPETVAGAAPVFA